METPDIETPKAKKPKIFFPNLDGLRFFSFFLVFNSHAFFVDYDYLKTAGWYRASRFLFFAHGWLGVNFFFVLSGFLITYLLLVEKNLTGKIHVFMFYVRRALRIWPLYYFCVFFGFVIFPILKRHFGQVPDETASPWLCSFFLNNFNSLINGAPDSSILSVLWSVAIEEQFYLVWPLLFFIVPKKQYIYLFFTIIVGSLSFRTFHVMAGIKTSTINDISDLIDIHTLGVISDMAIGGLGAYLAINSKKFLDFLENSKPIVGLIPYIGALIYILSYKAMIQAAPQLLIVKRLIPSLLFIWIILEQNFASRSFFKISQLKYISTLGKYTYGLYCLHPIAILVVLTLLRKVGLNKTSWEIICIQAPLEMALSIVLAYFSYTYFESWFLKFKDKFAFVVKS